MEVMNKEDYIDVLDSDKSAIEKMIKYHYQMAKRAGILIWEEIRKKKLASKFELKGGHAALFEAYHDRCPLCHFHNHFYHYETFESGKIICNCTYKCPLGTCHKPDSLYHQFEYLFYETGRRETIERKRKTLAGEIVNVIDGWRLDLEDIAGLYKGDTPIIRYSKMLMIYRDNFIDYVTRRNRHKDIKDRMNQIMLHDLRIETAIHRLLSFWTSK
jgi:hypothetical protein